MLGTAAVAFACAWGVLRARGRGERGQVLIVVLLVGFAALGAQRGAGAATAAAADCRAELPDGAPVEVVGVLGAGVRSLRGSDRAPPLLPLLGAHLRSGPITCRGELRVAFPEDAVPTAAGSELRVRGEWRRQRTPIVPSGWPRSPVSRGFVVVAEVLEARPAHAVRSPLLWSRGATEERLQRLFPRGEPIAEALLLGRREYLDPQIRDRFARAGLAHLLAISGMHVGLIAGIVMLAATALRVSRQRASAGTIVLLMLYLVMIGAPASAVRAGIMISLVLLARTIQRPSATLPLVSAAALFLTVRDPLVLLDIGFQLSFAGVLGILLARRKLLPNLAAFSGRSGLRRSLLEGTAVSAAAFVATAPVTAHHFGTVAPIAVLANLPAVPLMSLALIGIGAAALLDVVAPPVARLFAGGAELFLGLLDRVAGFAAGVPYGHLALAAPDWIAWAAAAAAIPIALHLARELSPRIRKTAAAGFAVALLLAWPALVGGAERGLEIHFLDVGQGDATAIRTPGGSWVLVDAGPRIEDFDAGERRVLPYLRRQRVTRLEAMVLTHPHADHIGGAPAVLRSLPVARVIEPGYPVPSSIYADVLQLVEQRGASWAAARSGRALRLDGVTFRLLWPDPDFLDHASDANQISAVVRVEFGSFALLLPGDVSQEVERMLVSRHGGDLRAQILKAAHHGSATSTSAEWLDAVSPELVVISAAGRNRYGHPAPSVLRRVGERGIEVAQTADGTLRVRVRAGPGNLWSILGP